MRRPKRHPANSTAISNSRLAFVTTKQARTPFGRKAESLAQGFIAIDHPFDVVYLHDSSRGAKLRNRGPVREIFLGVRSRNALPALVRYLKHTQPRLTLAAPGHIGPSAVIAGRLTGCPVIPWESTFVDRNFPEWPWQLRGLMSLQNLTYRHSPGIAVISDDIGHWVINHRPVERADLYKLPNPINIDALRRDGAAAGPRGEQSSTLVLSAVGRFAEQKGIDILLEALGRCSDQLPRDWKLRLVGKGTWHDKVWQDKIDRLVSIYRLAEHVERLGWMENPHAIMQQSDIFVHAARWEPFGNVLCEALALGVPTIATDCPGGPHEILANGRYGILVGNEDASALGNAIVELAQDSNRRLQLASLGPQRAADYTPATVARRIIEISDAVNAGGRR